MKHSSILYHHLYPQFLQHIALPILLLARPNNPVLTHRLVADIFCIFVLPHVGHLGLFNNSCACALA